MDLGLSDSLRHDFLDDIGYDCVLFVALFCCMGRWLLLILVIDSKEKGRRGAILRKSWGIFFSTGVGPVARSGGEEAQKGANPHIQFSLYLLRLAAALCHSTSSVQVSHSPSMWLSLPIGLLFALLICKAILVVLRSCWVTCRIAVYPRCTGTVGYLHWLARWLNSCAREEGTRQQ